MSVLCGRSFKLEGTAVRAWLLGATGAGTDPAGTTQQLEERIVSTKGKKVSSPNQSGSGFKWVVVILIAVAVVAAVAIYVAGRNQEARDFVGETVDDLPATVDLEGDEFVIRPEDAGDDVVHATIAEDFSCPHCAETNEADKDDLLEALRDGKMELTLRTQTFLDGKDQEGFSHHAFAALLAVEEHDSAEVFWNFRNLVFAHQSDIVASWGPEDFADAADELGASSETVKAISSGEFLDKAIEIGERNQEWLASNADSVAVPAVFVEGEQLEQLSDDWVTEALEENAG